MALRRTYSLRSRYFKLILFWLTSVENTTKLAELNTTYISEKECKGRNALSAQMHGNGTDLRKIELQSTLTVCSTLMCTSYLGKQGIVKLKLYFITADHIGIINNTPTISASSNQWSGFRLFCTLSSFFVAITRTTRGLHLRLGSQTHTCVC